MQDLSEDSLNDVVEKQEEQWILRHNNEIIGFFGSKDEAYDAMNGYQVENVVEIDDELEVRQVI